MTEVKVIQRSPEWFDLRESVYLTASVFGEAIGVGKGKPYDFLLSRLYKDQEDTNKEDQENIYLKHGVDQEPIICEAYELLMNVRTENSGFWLPSENGFHGNMQLIGASPDAKVYSKSTGEFIGLAEFKAPFHTLYNEKTHPRGIPRQYMAQMQGQMAVCNKQWCDFMAVCTKTRQIMLKRVHFSHRYWNSASHKLEKFCQVFQEAKDTISKGESLTSSPALRNLKNAALPKYPFPGEDLIRIDNLLETDSRGQFYSKSGLWLSFEFLMGIPSMEKFTYENNNTFGATQR